MALSDKQIESILTKDISAKTLLVNKDDFDEVVSKHLKDGWELVNKVQVNDRYKVTFRKVK